MSANLPSEKNCSMQNNKLLWWLMGIVAVVLVGLGGSWANGVYGTVDKVTEAIDRTNVSLESNNKELRVIVGMLSERVVKVETYIEIQRQQMGDLQRQLTRVETKVDELGRNK